jgi:hypothetical protein
LVDGGVLAGSLHSDMVSKFSLAELPIDEILSFEKVILSQ